MPTPLNDTLSPLHSHAHSAASYNQQLPLHHDAQFPHAQELDRLSPSGQRHSRSEKKGKEDTKHLLEDEDSDSGEEDSVEDKLMGAKSRKPKSLEPLGGSSSTKEGENGSTTSSMNNNVEYRRKNASLESPGVTANLMARESFSLDEPVPRTPTVNNHGFFELPMQDRRNFGLLVLLYFLQGVPMGLATGSVPFLLKGAHMSYSALGVFSLASYPYSLKLLWSPVVDAVWTPRLGRRKSWIMPIQMLSGLGMIWLGSQVKGMMVVAGKEDGSGIWGFTWWWFFLVFMCATQDIAVDGWALTLLTPGNISYASTAQTVGLTAGQFMSYTVFLAFNSPDFANKYFRAVPSTEGIMTLGGYLSFWGWAYIIVTLGLALLKQEEKTKNEDGIWDVYRVMWGVLKLKNIQTIIIIHLIAKIGFQANDAVTNLKLIDKGFSQEDLALTVLIDFPFEIGLGYYAGKWSTTYTPMRLWCWGFVGRLLAAVIAQITVIIFPANGVDTWYLLVVIAEHIFSTFTNTVMFVAISAFHARIADPVIGGTYMTLLATVSNLGGTFPRFFVLKLVDFFTSATCIPPSSTPKTLIGPLITASFDCALSAEKERCVNGGGVCEIERDGYYVMNIVCVIIGVVTFWGYIKPAALKLQALPLRAWRIAEER
ncbi:MFS general substrate transporter [Glarea lozoyensis ATCC 20868]|uniref:MFS general substrate transporter n=1 Tax=Glarea lozoyensis (strain ATCC 20868 / MF5171) TaxID=1116229 RepID=S3CEK8_GLAL2|nr:MFS general substrate transporter [Glarea lozoyensis ATCC 20868]EPE24932.1 MFS general substrate transporter [Glarea lozoyensis ATCC 20868]